MPISAADSATVSHLNDVISFIVEAIKRGVNYYLRMPSVNIPVPAQCEHGHPLSGDRAITIVKGKWWYCRECQNAYTPTRKRAARKPKPARVRAAVKARSCVQCGAPLPARAPEREKWCESGCFRAWYIARTGYQLAYQEKTPAKNS